MANANASTSVNHDQCLWLGKIVICQIQPTNWLHNASTLTREKFEETPWTQNPICETKNKWPLSQFLQNWTHNKWSKKPYLKTLVESTKLNSRLVAQCRVHRRKFDNVIKYYLKSWWGDQLVSSSSFFTYAMYTLWYSWFFICHK